MVTAKTLRTGIYEYQVADNGDFGIASGIDFTFENKGAINTTLQYTYSEAKANGAYDAEAVGEELSVKSESNNELNSDNNLNQSDVSQVSNNPERTGAEELDENENRIQNTMENSHEEEMKNDRKTLQEENQITNEVNEGQATNSIFEGVEDDTNIIDSDEDEDLLEIPAFLRRQAN